MLPKRFIPSKSHFTTGAKQWQYFSVRSRASELLVLIRMGVAHVLHNSAPYAHATAEGTLDFVTTIWRRFELPPSAGRRVLDDRLQVDFIGHFRLVKNIVIINVGDIDIEFWLFELDLTVILDSVTFELIPFWNDDQGNTGCLGI